MMKNKWKNSGVRAFALLTVLVQTSQASFEPVSVGARTAGMSDTATASADDALALYYNPAGLLRVRRPEISSSYSSLFSNFDDRSRLGRSFLGYVHPLSGDCGVLGTGILHTALGGLYTEDAWGVSYARRLGSAWNLGATVKALRRGYGSDLYTENAVNVDSGTSLGGADPVLAGKRSKIVPALDLGLLYGLGNGYTAGLALRSVNEPNMALAGERDPAPAVYATGLEKQTQSLLLVLDVSAWKFAGVQNYALNLGAERAFRHGFFLRGGGGMGSRRYRNASLGLSYRRESFQIDYAMTYPLQGLRQPSGVHLFSLTFRFGNSPGISPVQPNPHQTSPLR